MPYCMATSSRAPGRALNLGSRAGRPRRRQPYDGPPAAQSRTARYSPRTRPSLDVSTEVRSDSAPRRMTDRPSDTAPLSRRAAIGGGLMLGFLALLAAGPPCARAAWPADDHPRFRRRGNAHKRIPPVSPMRRPSPPRRWSSRTRTDGRSPSRLSSARPVLAFFGYTHCPDVCPVTVGVVNEVLAAVGDGPRGRVHVHRPRARRPLPR